MANISLVLSVLLVSSILLFHGVVARLNQASLQQGKCQINKINPVEPSQTLQAEAGSTEIWDHTDDQFQCAGVSVIRHRIRSKGLLLPTYTNFPLLIYIQEGRGIFGVLISGCPESYQSSQESSEEYQAQGRGQSFRDRHQKIRRFQKGDIIAIPAGAAHWAYNDGENDIVNIVLEDTTNDANQLDQTPRRFFLAGGQGQSGNVLRGIAVRFLAASFRIDEQLARRLQGRDNHRGHMVTVKRELQVIRPPAGGQQEERPGGFPGGEQQQPGGGNGLEETICSAKLRENIDNPEKADIYSAQAGRFTSINSLTFPILSFFKLSAERGVLYRNAIMSPHWYMNSHSVVYVTHGQARIQIVDHRGQTVFDDQVREGQVFVVPQNFVVIKQAGDQGFRWVAFNTNDNAMINTIAGRTSALRGLPIDVIANAYQISREQAEQLKYSRKGTLLFSASSSSKPGGVAIE